MNAIRFVKTFVSRVRGHPYLFLRIFYIWSQTQTQPQPHPLDDDANHDRRHLPMDATYVHAGTLTTAMHLGCCACNIHNVMFLKLILSSCYY